MPFPPWLSYAACARRVGEWWWLLLLLLVRRFASRKAKSSYSSSMRKDVVRAPADAEAEEAG